MQRTIQTTYRYRLNPTAEQESHLRRFAGARRFVWNWAMNRKRGHFGQTGKTLSFAALCAELTAMKQQPDMAWLREMDSQSLQQALRDLDTAYQHFFRRVRKGDKKKGFPKFKSRKTDSPRFRIPQRVTIRESCVSVPKIGLVKLVLHRPLEGVTKGATFKREACGHWYISLVVEQQIAPKVDRPVVSHIGIDVGLKTLADARCCVSTDGRGNRQPTLVSYPSAQTQARTKGAQPQSQRQSQPEQGATCGCAIAPENPQPEERLLAQTEYRRKMLRLYRHNDLVSIEDLNVRGLAKTKLSCDVRLSM